MSREKSREKMKKTNKSYLTRRTTKQTGPHYVDNKKFYNAIVEYRKSYVAAVEEGKEPPRIPEYVGECIYKISEKLSMTPSFSKYSFRDEMISDGIANCIQYFNSYNPHYVSKTGSKQNPFAYFTEISKWAFVRRINTEERSRYDKCKIFYDSIGTNNTMLVDSDNKHLLTPQMYDNISSFMENFERKEKEKKEKRKKIKEEGLEKFYKEAEHERHD